MQAFLSFDPDSSSVGFHATVSEGIPLPVRGRNGPLISGIPHAEAMLSSPPAIGPSTPGDDTVTSGH
jgi:hypothetical protein